MSAAPSPSGSDAGLRIVGVAHLFRLETSDDTRAVPTIVSAPPPARHHNLFALGEAVYGPDDSGFLLSDGTFCDRIRAVEIARASAQLTKPLISPPRLYSEDLW